MKRDDLPLEEIRQLAEDVTQHYVSGIDFPSKHLTALDSFFEDTITEALLRANPPTYAETRYANQLHEAERRAEV